MTAPRNLISIKIRTGSNGTAVFPGLDALRDKTVLLDRRMTWEQAFRTRFNLTLDPEVYCVQKLVRVGTPVKHDLREEINLLIGDFKLGCKTKSYVVFLVKSVKGMGRSPPAPGRKIKRRMYGSNDEDKEDGDYCPSNSVARRFVPPREKEIFLRSPQNSSYEADEDEDDIDIDQDTQENNDEDEYEDMEDDVQSIFSHGSEASQDSQMEDLIHLGVPYEDLKSGFCNKAEKTITNTQFLKAQDELQKLKRTHSSRWSKWTTFAPSTANIIRDLFDV